MVLYQEEKAYIDGLKAKLSTQESISKEDLETLIDKFEDLMEMSTVSFKMIDRLMHNYDQLKQKHADQATETVKTS